MTTNIVPTEQQGIDWEALLEQWMQQEQEGIEFPVPLHDYWFIAGHSTKRKCFDLAKSILEKGVDYYSPIGSKKPGRGRPSEKLQVSTAALEHLCLAAKTEQGKQVRELYRQSKRKWDLVKKHQPQIAQEVELLQLRNELAKTEQSTLRLKADIATMHGQQFALAAMGKDDQLVEVEKPVIEVVDQKTGVKFKGQTLTQVKTYLEKKTGQKFKSGADLKRKLEAVGFGHLIAQTPRVILQDYIPDELLDEAYGALNTQDRQILLGE